MCTVDWPAWSSGGLSLKTCYIQKFEKKEKEKKQQQQKPRRKERIKNSYLTHVKPLNPNKNPSSIFFMERMITIKTKFLKSGSAPCLVSCVIFVST